MLPRLFSVVAPKILAVARRHYNGVVEQTLLPRCHAKMYTTAFPIRIQGERPVDERCLCRACSYLVLTCFRDKHLGQDNERATAITRSPSATDGRRTDSISVAAVGGGIMCRAQATCRQKCRTSAFSAGCSSNLWGIRKS